MATAERGVVKVEARREELAPQETLYVTAKTGPTILTNKLTVSFRNPAREEFSLAAKLFFEDAVPNLQALTVLRTKKSKWSSPRDLYFLLFHHLSDHGENGEAIKRVRQNFRQIGNQYHSTGTGLHDADMEMYDKSSFRSCQDFFRYMRYAKYNNIDRPVVNAIIRPEGLESIMNDMLDAAKYNGVQNPFTRSPLRREHQFREFLDWEINGRGEPTE